MKKHEKEFKKYPELKKSIRKVFEEQEKVRLFYHHELFGPLNGLRSYIVELRKDNLLEGERDNYLKMMEIGVKRVSNLTNILYLKDFSQEELNKNKKIVNIEEMALGYGSLYDLYMHKKKIGLNIRYDKIKLNSKRNPIEIFTNSEAIESIWGTLIGNAMSWTPSEYNIDQGFRINHFGELEILIENKFLNEKQRSAGGLGKGLGNFFTKEIIQGLNGRFETYFTHKIKRNYDSQDRFGKKNEKDSLECSKVYGVKLILPVGELSN